MQDVGVLPSFLFCFHFLVFLEKDSLFISSSFTFILDLKTTFLPQTDAVAVKFLGEKCCRSNKLPLLDSQSL